MFPRTPVATLTLGLLAAAELALGAVEADAQELGRRIARAPDGLVRINFAARPGVCGDGRSFIGDNIGSPDGFTIYTNDGWDFTTSSFGDARARCLAGPVHVVFALRDGRVLDVRPFVGPTAMSLGRPVTELGTVPAADAASYLLSLANGGDERNARNAVLAATLADSARVSPTLMTMARNRSLRASVREVALRWIRRSAEREGNGDAEAAVRAIASDAGDVESVRERAIRELGGFGGSRPFLRSLYARLEESSLKERVIRVLGESGGTAELDWVRGIALDDRESTTLRERAIRVLGEEGGQTRILRELYPRLNETSLKERVIRAVGEAGDAESRRWLRSVIENDNEAPSARDRAVRVLAEQGEERYLREAYPSLADQDVQERVIRVVAEAGGTENIRWLLARARDERERTALRERALRSLAEAGVASAELVRLYDATDERTLRERLVNLLAERGDKTSRDKLAAIARSDPDEDLRRRALKKLAGT